VQAGKELVQRENKDSGEKVLKSMQDGHSGNITAVALAEGAVMAALAALLAVLSLYVPLLSFVLVIAWPIPLTVVVVRHGLKLGFLTTLVAGILVTMLAGPVQSTYLFLQYGLLGLIYGWCFRQKVSGGLSVLAGSLAAILGLFLVLFVSGVVLGQPLLGLTQLEEETRQIIDESYRLYEQNGLLEEMGITENEFRETMNQMVELVIRLIPASLAITSMMLALGNYLIATLILRRMGNEIPGFPPFREWRLPWYTSWGLIAGLLSWVSGNYWHLSWAVTLGQNILLVMLVPSLVQGLAIITYYYHRWRLSPLIKALIIFLLVLNLQISLLVVIALGAFDPLVNYRKLGTGGS